MQLGGATVVEAKIRPRGVAEFSGAVFCIATGIDLVLITAGVSAVLGAVASRYCNKFADAVMPEEDCDKKRIEPKLDRKNDA